MAKALSDTQLTILSAACQRDAGSIYPVATKLSGGALTKVLSSLLRQGLAEEIPARLHDEVWRTAEDGTRFSMKATAAANRALGIDASDSAPSVGGNDAALALPSPVRAMASERKKAPKATQAAKGSTLAAKGAGRRSRAAKATVGKTRAKEKEGRTGTKQAALIEMLQTKKGATVAEIMAATGWQPHTVRGAIAGALKKKLGLKVVSEKIEGRGRVYRIETDR
jgi:hypothetical protein